MKNEEIIMGEVKEGIIMNNANVEKTPVNREGNKKTNKLSIEKDGGRIVQRPETSKQEAVAGAEKFINLKPEIEEKLKKFNVEVEIGDKKEIKTALDAVNEMNVLSNKELSSEEKSQAYLKGIVLVDKLMQEYENKPEEKKELQEVLFSDVFGGGDKNKGEKAQEWFQDQKKVFEGGGGQVDIEKLAEIMDLKLDTRMRSELGELAKSLPVPWEGSGGDGRTEVAPIVTVGEDGQITITPAPLEEGKEVTPGISEISKSPDTPGGKPTGSGDGGKKKVVEEEKKKKDKFEWEKWGSGLLFLLILYLGLQGWYAKMIEQSAERFRS